MIIDLSEIQDSCFRHRERSVAIHEFKLHGLPRRFAPRIDGRVRGPYAVSGPIREALNDDPDCHALWNSQ